jgi:hypothetical protein
LLLQRIEQRRKQMAYQDEHGERRRIVVETPNERREVEHSEQISHPRSDGVSAATLAAVVIAVIALAAVTILFVLNRQDTLNSNTTAQQQPPQTIIQQPAQQPAQPIVVQQPAPATQPAPIVVNNPPASAGGPTSSKVSDDSSIQAAVDKKLSDDPTLEPLGISAMVVNGKATLTGVVKTESLKAQAERVVRSVKGVKSVDNQITVGY